MIGVVADESNLYDEMSNYDNLCFCGSLYGLTKKERGKKADELLKTFQLFEVRNKNVRAYSKGMKRKLTIAAALIHDPEILFLDEPTAGIDVASVRQIRNIIKNLNEKGALSITLDLIILIASCCLLFYFSIRNIKRKWIV